MKNKQPVTDQQAATSLLHALDAQPTVNCDDVLMLLPELIEAERAGEDVQANAEFATLLKHLDECADCSEMYGAIAGDLDATLGEEDVLPEVAQYPKGFFTPQPKSAPEPRAEKLTLADISNYFLIIPARDENRSAVRTISRQVLKKVDPNHSTVPPFVIDTLLDKAAQGKMVASGVSKPFGFGSFELLIQILVPLAVNLVSASLWRHNVSSIQELKARQLDIEPLTEAQVKDLLVKAGMKANANQITTLTNEINTAFRALLA